MARFYEADTTDGIPVLINIDHIVKVEPKLILQDDGTYDYNMDTTTIDLAGVLVYVDVPYETVVKSIKLRQDSPKEKIY